MSVIHPNNDIAEDEQLRTKNAEYHKLVLEWAFYPSPPKAFFFYPLDLMAPGLSKRKIKARLCENIAYHLKTVRVDSDKNGQLTEEEVAAKEEESKSFVDGYLNLLTNFGVTGALFFSVLFGFVVTDITPSEESVEFFGTVGAKWLKYTFLVFVNGSVMMSLLLIFRSIQIYKHLSFWMPDITAQLEYMEEVSITSIVIIANLVVWLSVLSIPLGAATAISPNAGLISTIFVALMLVAVREVTYLEERTELILQRNARRILSKKSQ